MSLMNTVTKLAIGFALAKGVEAVRKQGGIGQVMEGLAGRGTAQAGAMGGLGDILGQLGGAGGAGGASGGLGDLLGKLGGGGSGAAPAGLGDLLGQLTGGGASSAGAGALGGLGGLLGGLASARGGAGDLEALINQDNPPATAQPDEDEVARLMLRAMTQAARADGDIDAGEKAKLVDALRAGDAEDVEVVQAMLEAPVDPEALASDTPRGLETQVYTMSVNAIDPDNRSEADYLDRLSRGLGLQPEVVNRIHDGIGVPRLYR